MFYKWLVGFFDYDPRSLPFLLHGANYLYSHARMCFEKFDGIHVLFRAPTIILKQLFKSLNFKNKCLPLCLVLTVFVLKMYFTNLMFEKIQVNIVKFLNFPSPTTDV